LAEDTGLILDIGYYMMEEAFNQLRIWQTDFVTSTGKPLSMNVNLSVTQLRDPKLLREIERVKMQSAAAAHSMVFEITESAVLGDTKRAIALLNDIRDLGFRLRVDDFGTGYSSLSYLKKLPIDGFKIDKSFVSGLNVDVDDTAIIRALLGLAHAMSLTVTAEGIEQDAQRIALKEMGCDYGQGYLFSAAVPPEEIVLPTRAKRNPAKGQRDTA
jgi:EAL domain-containing protein (putative c-di-GMP-specific phosphodiesterase class I)